MDHSISGVTGAALKAALDAASLRQTAGAANIANATRPGYVPLRVSFEDALQEALRNHAVTGGTFEAPAPVLEMESAADASGAPPAVRLDDESARLVTNALHYQALLSGYRGLSDILSTVISDGRR